MDRLSLQTMHSAAGSQALLAVPAEGEYELRAYDVSGRRTREVFRGRLSAGYHEITWNHRDDAGYEVASGVYFLRLRGMGGNDEEATARLVIVR